MTIYQRDMVNDLVRIEYGDGEVRDFRRARPVATDDAEGAPSGKQDSPEAGPPSVT
ncbi:MAG: hypothetical protein L6Q99_21745 [Planctomycetes bacterium]|nr:hypothetical protein [Planctomycetota bacterium]